MSEKSISEKAKIRQSILQLRKLSSESELKAAENKMLKVLQNWDLFKNASSIHIYISKKYEPKTRNIINFCWESSKKVSVPCVLPGEVELFHTELNSFKNLKIGPFGVLEPPQKNRIASKSDSFDIVIVPGIAFDLKGGRIGYGKGFYDRFLAQTSAFRLALAFDYQVFESIPTESHDVKMNAILTESRKIEI